MCSVTDDFEKFCMKLLCVSINACLALNEFQKNKT